MDLDDLYNVIDEFEEDLEEPQPLSDLCFSEEFITETALTSPDLHKVLMDVSRTELGILHPDRTENQEDYEPEDIQYEFNRFQEARSMIENYEDFVSYRDQLNAEDSISVEVAHTLRTTHSIYDHAQTDQQNIARLFYNLTSGNSCSQLRNVNIQFIDAGFLGEFQSAYDDQHEQASNKEAELLINAEIDRRLEQESVEIIERALMEDHLELALIDKRIQTGLERYVAANPDLQNLSQEELADIDIEEYEHLYQDITTEDLDMEELWLQVKADLETQGKLPPRLPQVEISKIRKKYEKQINSRDDFTEAVEATKTDYHDLKIDPQGQLSVKLSGRKSFTRLDNTHLLGFVVGLSELDLNDKVLRPCGFDTMTAPAETIPESIADDGLSYNSATSDPLITRNLRLLNKVEEVEKNGFQTATAMPLKDCGMLLANLTTSLQDPEVQDQINSDRIRGDLDIFVFTIQIKQNDCYISYLGRFLELQGLSQTTE